MHGALDGVPAPQRKEGKCTLGSTYRFSLWKPSPPSVALKASAGSGFAENISIIFYFLPCKILLNVLLELFAFIIYIETVYKLTSCLADWFYRKMLRLLQRYFRYWEYLNLIFGQIAKLLLYLRYILLVIKL